MKGHFGPLRHQTMLAFARASSGGRYHLELCTNTRQLLSIYIACLSKSPDPGVFRQTKLVVGKGCVSSLSTFYNLQAPHWIGLHALFMFC